MAESHLFRPFGPAPWDNYREKNGIPENTGPTFYTPSKKECKRIRKEMKKIEKENRIFKERVRNFCDIFKFVVLALVVIYFLVDGMADAVAESRRRASEKIHVATPADPADLEEDNAFAPKIKVKRGSEEESPGTRSSSSTPAASCSTTTTTTPHRDLKAQQDDERTADDDRARRAARRRLKQHL